MYYSLFYILEDNNILDVNDNVYLSALHYVYIPRISNTLSSFREAWNLHRLSSSGNQSPLQLCSSGMLFHAHNYQYLAVQEVFAMPESDATLSSSDTESDSSGHSTAIPVTLHELNPLAQSSVWGVDI